MNFDYLRKSLGIRKSDFESTFEICSFVTIGIIFNSQWKNLNWSNSLFFFFNFSGLFFRIFCDMWLFKKKIKKSINYIKVSYYLVKKKKFGSISQKLFECGRLLWMILHMLKVFFHWKFLLPLIISNPNKSWFWLHNANGGYPFEISQGRFPREYIFYQQNI